MLPQTQHNTTTIRYNSLKIYVSLGVTIHLFDVFVKHNVASILNELAAAVGPPQRD
jgi:hypothetical protein